MPDNRSYTCGNPADLSKRYGGGQVDKGLIGYSDTCPSMTSGVIKEAGTSIFDPVLCEIIYTWFINGKGNILDPFAGGSVRGIVATYLGHKYIGIDLLAEQIKANQEQAEKITPDNLPNWIVGDSNVELDKIDEQFDLVFSCPPYFDLEVYSDNPADLSVMAWDEFIAVYHSIISKAVSKLKDNSFACFVVGDIRDNKGFYRNLPAITIDAFQYAGMTLYNEAILVNVIGSLPIRINKQFNSGRKLGKCHQNVLIFYKGDPKKIKDWGEIIPENEEYTSDKIDVKISAASAKTLFVNCEPEYIKNVCHGSCCQSSTRESGTPITINPLEEEKIKSIGGIVVNGILQTPNKICPFKTSEHLCSLHNTDAKPFGCIASPFTINNNNTLIIRNRYKMLKCFKDKGSVPAYKTFRASLDLIFGIDEAEKICIHLDNGGGDIIASMPIENYKILKENDKIKHNEKQ